MKRQRLLLTTIVLLLPLVLFAQDEPGTMFDNTLEGIRDHFCPDKRIAVFSISAGMSEGSLVLRGETDNPAARDSLLVAARLTGTPVIDSIMVLPHPALGDSTYGIVVLSVGNVRSRPGHSEELATQVTMGLVIRLLKRGRGYYYVQSHDEYLGWLEPDAFQRTTKEGTEAWARARKVVVTEYFDVIRSTPDRSSLPVSDVVIGNILRAGESSGDWQQVFLADGRSGYLPAAAVLDYDAWSKTRNLTGENIEATAAMFLGVPYLWGGTSSKGMDCSGYTKTVFRLNGLELNRDASQQVLMGRDVDPGPDFENLVKGDLLFFGRPAADGQNERIVHVAIYLENRDFIHSSGRVRFGSLDPASPNFDDYNLKRFVRARRVIPEPTVPEK